ncbi:MAG: hypothetical protein ACO1OO_12910 [Flavisolibacter sp.]
MTTIDINEFEGYAEQDIYAFLEIEDPRLIEVYLPLKFQDEKDRQFTADDYFIGAYSGQLISDISVEFIYNLPFNENMDCFAFLFICDDRKKLAAVLHRIISATYDDDLCWQFLQEAGDFLVNPSNAKRFACPDYIRYLNTLFPDDE